MQLPAHFKGPGDLGKGRADGLAGEVHAFEFKLDPHEESFVAQVAMLVSLKDIRAVPGQEGGHAGNDTFAVGTGDGQDAGERLHKIPFVERNNETTLNVKNQ